MLGSSAGPSGALFAGAGARRAVSSLIVALAVASQAGSRPLAASTPAPAASRSDSTFPHERHGKFPCLTCHLDRSGAMLTFERPRGCQNCHHKSPATSDCIHCHRGARLPKTVDVTFSVAAASRPPRARTVAFPHEKHWPLGCAGCHTVEATLQPADSVATCHGCHDRHHTVGRDCATCHRTATIKGPHLAPTRPHVACNLCHPTAVIAPLTPTRSFCLVCHESAVDHNRGEQCTSCHMQESPEDYREHLLMPDSTS